MATDFDFELGGLKFHLLRDVPETPGYIQRWVRNEITSQSALGGPSLLQSRSDITFLHQTSWAGGSTWWMPMLSATEPDSFYHSFGVDTWSRPGTVQPNAELRKMVEDPSSEAEFAPALGARTHRRGNRVWSLGAPEVGGGHYVYWDDEANTWIEDPSVFADYVDSSDIHWGITDVDDVIYSMVNDTIRQGATSIIVLGNPPVEGANLLAWNNELLVYDGNSVLRIDDPLGTPTAVEIFDDGQGQEWLGFEIAAGKKIVRSGVRLAVNTPEGIYYVKNVSGDDGVPSAWVYRVERTNDGQWLGYPETVLPRGTVALDITHHLGSILVSTTIDYTEVTKATGNQQMRTQVYHITGSNMGLTGQTLGYNDTYGLWDHPYKFLGAQGPLLYMAGSSSMWVYDAVRGGFHMVGYLMVPNPLQPLEYQQSTAPTWGVILDNNGSMVLQTRNYHGVYEYSLDPTATINRGELESNWFDFGVPYETKTLYKVELLTDHMDDDVVWEVYVAAAEDSVWTKAGETGAGRSHVMTLATPMTGTMFRYKLVYGDITPTESWTPGFNNLDPDVRSSVRGIKLFSTSGESVREWIFTVDGSQVYNVDNMLLHPDDIRDDVEAIFDPSVMTLTDYTGNILKDAEESATVKLQMAEISAHNPEGYTKMMVHVREV